MTEFIQISEVNTENRQRKHFDDLAILDLAEGIEQHELLHAPVLLGDSPTLIAGERRLRAMEMLHRKGVEFKYNGELVPTGMAPVIRASDRNPLALKEAELAENLLRLDLTWQERVSAERELHELRLAQTGGKQTLKQTAQELAKDSPNPNTKKLSENILLSKHLEDPEIAKVKDRKVALRKVLQKEQAEKRAKVIETLKIQALETSPHKILHGPMDEVLRAYEGESSFDLLLTDPPYGVDAGGFNSQFTIQHSYEDSALSWPYLMKTLAEESYRLCKEEAHAFVFCDIRKWPQLEGIFIDAGWDVWPRPLIWDKGALGALPKPGYGPRYCYEAILFASKGNKKVLRAGRDVLDTPNQTKERHAAEKPVDLYVELIERVAEGGSYILDPFAGSGTLFPACSRTGCYGVGVEIKEEYYNICLERIHE